MSYRESSEPQFLEQDLFKTTTPESSLEMADDSIEHELQLISFELIGVYGARVAEVVTDYMRGVLQAADEKIGQILKDESITSNYDYDPEKGVLSSKSNKPKLTYYGFHNKDSIARRLTPEALKAFQYQYDKTDRNYEDIIIERIKDWASNQFLGGLRKERLVLDQDGKSFVAVNR